MKLTNYLLNKLEIKLKKINLISQPINIGIEVTTKCNLKCIMCNRTYMDKKYLNKDMSFKDFKYIINKIQNTSTIFLTGTGETLMNKNIFKMIKYLKDKKFKVGFVDNFTLLNKEKSKKLLKIGLDHIVVSIDSLQKEIYEEIRQGTKFETFIKNLKDFIELKNKMNSNIKISSSTVIMKNNINDIKNINKLLDKLEIRNRTLNTVDTYDIPKEIEKKIKTKKMNQKKPFKKMSCLSPFNSIVITYNSEVIPCCVIAQHRNRNDSFTSFGNLKTQSLNEIWNNHKFKLLRKCCKEGNLPLLCKNCTYFKRCN